MTSCAQPGGNIARTGARPRRRRPASSNPAGTFIQALASVTKKADAAPLGRDGRRRAARWSRGPTRSQP